MKNINSNNDFSHVCQFSQNEYGMTLIEIFIGLGITSIMTMAVMMMAQMSTSVSKTARTDSAIDTQVALTRMVLSHREWCRIALRQSSGTPGAIGDALSSFNTSTTPPSIHSISQLKKDGDGNWVHASSILQLGDNGTFSLPSTNGIVINPIPSGGLLTNQTRMFSDGTLHAFNIATTTITFNFMKNPPFVGSQQTSRSIPIEFVLGPTDGSSPTPNNIFECYAKDVEQASMEAGCTAIGGVFDSSKNPPCRLPKLGISDDWTDRDSSNNSMNNGIYTKGNIKVGSGHLIAGNGALVLNVGQPHPSDPGDQTGFYVRSINSPYAESDINGFRELFYVKSNGRVGIGTTSPTAELDVKGGINSSGNINSASINVSTSVSAGGWIKPGSTLTVGSNCSTTAGEGAIGYDSASHSPVFCSHAGIWQKFSQEPAKNSMIGGCTVYVDHGGVVLGHRFCWGTAVDSGTTFSCGPLATKMTMLSGSDKVSNGEYANNGVNLFTKCSADGPHTCHVSLDICVAN